MYSGELVNDKYVFKLLEDRLYASDCMINGWILTGFPKNSTQMNYLDMINTAFKPTLIVIIDVDDEYVIRRSSMKRIDPVTGKTHIQNSSVENRRLIVKNEDKPEVLDKRLDNWKKFNNSVLSQNLEGRNVLRLNGETNIDTLVENISDAMENAS